MNKAENYDSSLQGQRRLRLDKIKQLKDLGIDPYPARSTKTHPNSEIVDDFDNLNGKTVTVTGRITAWREHGGIMFADLRDDSSQLQLYIKQNELLPLNLDDQTLGWDQLNLVDIGDFVQAEGQVIKTERGQISVLVQKLQMLVKTIRPLPSKWHGLQDKEERFRRRYLDMTMNPEVKERMKRRALFWQAHREFLNDRGFSEVNIPILEHIPGGGDAVPFTTHMNAINEDFYLRISHELPLKRLIGAGFEKVYDIGARFRNEGLSDEHLPEHVAMEFYWAYADWKAGMKLIEEMYDYVLDRVYGGKKQFTIRGFEVDFSRGWEKIDFGEVMKNKFGIENVYNPDLVQLKDLLKENKIDFNPETINVPRAVDSLWKVLRKEIAGPAFLINHPKYLSPLQKASTENPLMVERMQPIIAGSELGNGWSEVNDPVDQYKRFVEQQEMREAGDDEAQWLDIDYVEMLEYGMAPNFGWGHSERLFWFLEDVTAREGVPFPQLKYLVSQETRELYPEIDFDTVRDFGGDDLEEELIDLKSLPQLSLAEVDPEVSDKFGGIKFGYVVLENIKVSDSSDRLNQIKKALEPKIKSRYEDKSAIKQTPNISGFRDLYKSFGANPNSNLNSSEALLRRIVDGKGLYSVNNVVDTYNITSAELELPMAAYDLDQVSGKLQLRLAKSGDQITKIAESEATDIPEGHLVYADNQGVTCMDYNYRDSDRTKVTKDTTKIIVFVDGHAGITEAQIMQGLTKVSSRLKDVTGGKVVGYGLAS